MQGSDFGEDKYQYQIKIVAILFALVLSLSAGMGIGGYRLSSRVVIDTVEQALPQLALQGAEIIEKELEATFETLELMALMDQIEDPEEDIDVKISILGEFADKYEFLRLGIADPDGTMNATDGTQTTISEREHFIEALAGRRFVTSPFNSKVDNSLIVAYTAPIRHGGEIVGVLVGIKPASSLTDIVNNINFRRWTCLYGG